MAMRRIEIIACDSETRSILATLIGRFVRPEMKTYVQDLADFVDQPTRSVRLISTNNTTAVATSCDKFWLGSPLRFSRGSHTVEGEMAYTASGSREHYTSS